MRMIWSSHFQYSVQEFIRKYLRSPLYVLVTLFLLFSNQLVILIHLVILLFNLLLNVVRFFLLFSHQLVSLIYYVILLLNLSLKNFGTQTKLLMKPLMLLLRLTVR
ncbi:hypothetical protein Gogos_020665 [Gossypium gossypioides]|uniref:Uncharacterized protein n=1 Tax=Gossypium gossypioides TaxID=34282 RepID=A0A7J9D5N3_GOSGO|nr:hypothetical protein [Gossypium gossypioides]